VGYDDIRKALENFCVTNLHLVSHLGHDLLCSNGPLAHPSAVYAVTITAQKIALYWDGESVPDDSASAVESHIKPAMLAVLDAAESDPARLVDALDNLARAYSHVTPLLKTPDR
jgi:hypothetical protein